MRAAIFRNGNFVVDDIKDPTPSALLSGIVHER